MLFFLWFYVCTMYVLAFLCLIAVCQFFNKRILLLYGDRTGKLRVRVYPRVGSGMGRNFRRGSGTGTGNIIGYGYGSGS